MGFIENLRRQKEAERQAAERAKQLTEAKARQEQELESLKEQERARIVQECEKAKTFLNRSEFPSLTRELASLVHGMRQTNLSMFSYNKKLKEVGVKFRIIWNEVQNRREVYEDRKQGMLVQHSYKFIEIHSFSDGRIDVNGDTLSYDEWYQKPYNAEKALERAFSHPRICNDKTVHWHNSNYGSGPCLPGNSPISTPNGLVLIKDLRVGDYVWTIDRFGRKPQTVIVKKTKRPAAKNHKMIHVVLKDGRKLVVSPGHPTIDYKEIGNLVKGDEFDMSYVASIKVMPYIGKYTYDILPYGETGGYWANNILIGSTLSDQFQKNKHSKFPLQFLYKPLYLSL